MEEKSEENQTVITPDFVDISGTIKQIMLENDLKLFEPDVIHNLEAFAESNIICSFYLYLFHLLICFKNRLYCRNPYKS